MNFWLGWGVAAGGLLIFASLNSTAVLAAYMAYLILVVSILNYGEPALSTIWGTSPTGSGTAGRNKINF